MGVMALFHLQKMFSFRYFFLKKIDLCIGFIKYGQVRFRVKSANYNVAPKYRGPRGPESAIAI